MPDDAKDFPEHRDRLFASARCRRSSSVEQYLRHTIRWPIRRRCIAAIVLRGAFLFACSAGICAGVQAQGVPLSSPQSAVALSSFAPLVRKVLPAVVNVSATLKPSAASGNNNAQDQTEGPEQGAPPTPFDELLRRFFEQQGIPQPQPREQNIALGSGFIVDPGGYIVTNGHVVENSDSVTVIFNDNSRHPAKIVGQDPLTDLALLKIDAPQALPYVGWGDSDAAQVGDWVLAVGNPFGLGNTVSYGIISARGRDIHAGPYDDFLQIDASINRGNSGGPTFDLNGNVIGVNTAIYSPNGGSVGIGFAIPSSLAKTVTDQIHDHGKVARGWLGVQIQEVSPEIAKSLGLAAPAGALVAGVVENGPAAKAGFKPGDVVLSFDGHEIAKMRDLPIIVAETPIGKKAQVEVWRNDAKIAITSVVGEMPENLRAAQSGQGATPRPSPQIPQRTSVMGLQLAPLDDTLRQRLNIPGNVKGVVVMAVAPNSPFAMQDIAPGDVIEMVDRQPVAAPADVANKLKELQTSNDGTLLLLVNRDGENRFVALSLSKDSQGGTNKG